MTWHLSHRPTQLYYAVSAAMLCAMGAVVTLPSAAAATLGKTTITSSQHEPLVAIISVSDIETADFSASLASPVLYQQLGLSPTDSMSVSFVPTSATTGQVVISTSQPVSKPFADVVLAINDKGKRNVIPKTLLMPLSTSVPIKPQNRVIATAIKPNLPVISSTNAKPLAVKRGTPPPLFEQSLPQTASLASNRLKSNLSQNLPTMSVDSAPNLPFAQTAITQTTTAPRTNQSSSSISNNRLATGHNAAAVDTSTLTTSTLTIAATNRVTSRADDERSNNINQSALATNAAVVPSAPANTTNKGLADTPSVDIAASSAADRQQSLLNQNQLQSSAENHKALNTPPANKDFLNNASTLDNDTLNIEVTRQITVHNSPINKVDSTKSPTLALKFDDSIALLSAAKLSAANSERVKSEAAATQKANSLAKESTADSQPALTSSAANDVKTTNPAASNIEADDSLLQSTQEQSVTYTVQRNDNLWIISQQIAKQNNLDISVVMRQIKAQNPDAFINQDAGQLKANAQLSLPNYEVVPSQSSIQAAIAAQRERSLQRKDAMAKTKRQSKLETLDKAESATAKATTKPSKPANKATTTQTLPQARFSVVAPGGKGEADGTQTKATTATGSGLDTNILASLKSSRKSTATQAQRVISTSNTLGSYTQKLQLQNQKLAELEERLKKLRNQ
ncbi:peptigoglycan-binding protein LysM [Psychrobacter sp. AH5]|uniref:type IV pilus assembly protein FimV n=1 Tax=Psychrobacter sp. AH5 TaxID=2937433 RepID=UPI00333EBD65